MMDVDGNLLSSFNQMRASTFNFVLFAGFLIGFSAVGFVVWIVAFNSQRRGRKEFMANACQAWGFSKYSSAKCVYKCLNSLFLINLLFGITSIVLGSSWIDNCENIQRCDIVEHVFHIARSLSVIFNVGVSLVSMFHLSYPRQGPRYVLFEFALSIVIVAVVLTYLYAPNVHYIFVAVVIFLLTLIVGIISRAPLTTPSLAFKRRLIVVVSSVSSFVIFLPSFVLQCLYRYTSLSSDYFYTWGNVVFYTSFNVIVDGVLCALILSLSNEEQQQQQQHPPQWQIPLPELKQPPSPWQQPAPQWQQPAPQWQQPAPQWQNQQQWQQPPPPWQHGPQQWQQRSQRWQ